MSSSAAQNGSGSATMRVRDIIRHLIRALRASRALPVKIKRDLENRNRGLLKNLWLVIGHAKFNVFAFRAKELIEDRRDLVLAFILITLLGPATAQSSNPAETAIRDALMKWTSHFNAGDRGEICGLFAADQGDHCFGRSSCGAARLDAQGGSDRLGERDDFGRTWHGHLPQVPRWQ